MRKGTQKNQISYPLGGWPTNWKIGNHTVSPTEVRVLSSTHGSSSWEGHGIARNSPQRIRLWRLIRLIAWTPEDWVKQKLHIWRVHTKHRVHGNPEKEQWLHRTLGQTDCRSWRVCWGGRCMCASPWAQEHWWQGYLGVLTGRLEAAILTQRPRTTQQPVSTSAGPCRANNQQGRSRALLISRQAAQNLPEPPVTTKHTYWHGSAPQRDRTQLHTPVGGHQDLLAGSLHKPQDHLHPPGSRVRHKKRKELRFCHLWKETTAQS